jgi:hypothetical protein
MVKLKDYIIKLKVAVQDNGHNNGLGQIRQGDKFSDPEFLAESPEQFAGNYAEKEEYAEVYQQDYEH